MKKMVCYKWSSSASAEERVKNMKKKKNIENTKNAKKAQKLAKKAKLADKKAKKIEKKTQKMNRKASDMLLPKAYRPLSTKAYLGLTILYIIPVIGWIFMLAHAIDAKNRHTRTYARSWFCGLFTFIVVAVIAIIIAFSLNLIWFW